MSKKRPVASVLSERQGEVLQLIGEALRERGYAPTVREICQQLGMSSPANVHRHLHVLQDQGFLRMDARTMRSIVLTEDGIAALCLTDEDAEVAKAILRPQARGVRRGRGPSRRLRATQPAGLLVVGRIAAGAPLDAIENSERFDLASAFDPERHFLLRVKGDSMIEAHIADGDMVVIRQQQSCHDGDIVAAVIDGEATLKRFFRRKDHILLKPANSAMQPLKVKNVEVRGVLAGVIRKVS